MKKLLSLVLVIAMVVCTVPVVFAAMEGSGTEADPYLIKSWDDFQALDSDVAATEGKYYKLMTDIDVGANLTTSTTYGDRKLLENWGMISDFKGTFDGNGHKIHNYSICNWGSSGIPMGLFGKLSGNAVVKNLGVEDVVIALTQWVGRDGNTGGFVGKLYDYSTLTDCYVKNVTTYVTTDTEVQAVGGMIGRIESANATVRNCYAVGCDIANNGVNYQAELIGMCAVDATIENCYAQGHLMRAWDNVQSTIKLSNSYATEAPLVAGNGDWTGDDSMYLGTVVTEDVLKGYALQLGDAYNVDSDNINGGFPILKWQGGTEPEVSGLIQGLAGEGTEVSPVLIGSVSDWNTFANAVIGDPTKMAAGKYYKLTADIDFENADYTLFIGTEVHPFQATFDGDGHKITNVRIKNTADSNMTYGLFGYVAGDAVIKNVGVENIEHYYSTTTSTVWSQSSFGGLIAVLAGNAKVEYCYSKNVTVDTKRTDNIPDWSSSWAKFTGDQISFAGGLIGKTVGGNCVVENCYGLCFEDLSNSSSSTGSIFGGLPEGSFKYIKNCYSDTHIGYCKPADVDKGINCYATKVSGWSAYDAFIGTGATVDELKLAANKLGGAFATDKNNVNGGYPVFAAVRGFDVVTNVVKSGNTITSIDVVKNSAVAGKVIVAAYDSNGFLLTTKVADVPAAGGTVAIGLDATGATVVKAYILKADGEATPTSSINIL